MDPLDLKTQPTEPDPARRELGGLSLAELEARARRAHGGLGLPLRQWAALAEAWRIAQALREARGNRSAAARALGIGRRTLYAKLDRLGFVERHREGSCAPPAFGRPRLEPGADPAPGGGRATGA